MSSACRGDSDKYTHTPNKQQIAWTACIFTAVQALIF